MKDYDIIEKYSNEYKIKCSVCGNEKMIKPHNYNRTKLLHNTWNCGDNYYKHFIGMKYGDYEVIEYLGNKKFLLQCNVCKVTEIIQLESLKRSNSNFQHGMRCIRNVPDSEYKKSIVERFNDMKQRCTNPNNNNYPHYGARGITVEYKYPIDLYMDFIDELKEHAEKYGLSNSTFDRIDVNGNYCKENLRISTQSIQSTNTTRKKVFILEKDNERVLCDNAMEFGRRYGVNGRSVGNVTRGTSKTAGGWRLVRIVGVDENIDSVIINEGVTTKLITT